MKEQYIDSPDHFLYKRFQELYKVSFPLFEQRSEQQQMQAFRNDKYRLLAFTENEAFVGFISYWEFDTYLYVEHLAIDTEMRGKGYGSRMLDRFIRSQAKIVLLEIDPVVDEVSMARSRFYTRCGFFHNPYKHKHPPYRKEFPPHPLIVLTTERPITETEYRMFNDHLVRIVMNRTPEYPTRL